MLHPCKTADLMQLLLCDDRDLDPTVSVNAVAWASIPDIDDAQNEIRFSAVKAPLESVDGNPVDDFRQLMNNCLSDDGTNEHLLRYLEAWFRLVGPVVGLRMNVQQLMGR